MTTLQFQNTVLDEVCPAGEAWMCEVKKGQLFRIVDLEGNQAVDTLFISAENPNERYSATDTLTQNQQIYLEQGTTLYSNFALLCYWSQGPPSDWHTSIQLLRV